MPLNLANIPKNPGIYVFSNAKGTIIYIGKAKNLRNRVRSYFAASNELTAAKYGMVREIASLDCTIVNTEHEALLLEASLIKKHQPKYNIVLKDDKNWTYIVITRENLPRIITTRGTDRIKGEYFGPYTNSKVARTIAHLLYKIFPLAGHGRSYSSLPRDLVSMQEYLGLAGTHVNQRVAYASLIAQARAILKGDTKPLRDALQRAMAESARDQAYEKARLFRDKLTALERIREPQDVVHPFLADQDIIGVASIETHSTVAVMQLRNGHLQDTLHIHLTNRLQDDATHVVEQFIAQYYGQIADKPAVVVLPCPVSDAAGRILAPARVVVPQRGSKKRLSALAEKNALLDAQRSSGHSSIPHELYRLKTILGLPRIPMRIEAYDISNIVGTSAVGAMIVAQKGAFKKSDYRKFRIKTVRGSNDVAMMREVLMRRMNHDEWPEPDLILLDGGKPQLHTVYPILKASWRGRVAALAKREEELFVPGRAASIRLPKDDPALLLLRKIRNEVHRSAISYFRLLHRKKQAGRV